MFLNGSFAKRPHVAHMFHNGWWRLAVGGWRLVAVGGGWRQLKVGDWWLMAVGSGWQLAVGTPAPLVCDGPPHGTTKRGEESNSCPIPFADLQSPHFDFKKASVDQFLGATSGILGFGSRRASNCHVRHWRWSGGVGMHV